MLPFRQMGKGDTELSFEFQFQGADPEQQEDPMMMIYNNHQQEEDVMVDSLLYGGSGQAADPHTISFSGMRAPVAPSPKRGRGRARGPAGRGEADDDEKKVKHRDIERQRRQEMAAHLSTLRSLLPLDHLKGKRSTTDHIAESAKYIKELEGRIKELGDKRDQLKLSTQSSSSSSTSTSAIANNVEVFMSTSAVHVQITCREGAPLLSASLNLLLQSGLDVLSCVTNRLPGGAILHNIHCSNPNTHHDQEWAQFDLQNKLYQLISN